jgi:DNA modification methylase
LSRDVTLHLGDCLAVLPTLPAASFDAVVTDPPYGQTNEKYDRGVDPEVWRECYRVCGPNAALLSFAGSPTYHRIASAIEAAGWKVRQMWAWVYGDGMISSAWPAEGFDRLAPAMTPIVYATKGKVLLRLSRDARPWTCHGRRTGRQLSGRSRRSPKLSGEGRWPRSVVASDDADGFEAFVLARGAGQNEPGKGHPNRKPLALMRWLCAKLPPGRILDPFAGSGTTLIAATEEGHVGAVGIERDPEYFAVAQRRVADAAGPLFAEAT